MGLVENLPLDEGTETVRFRGRTWLSGADAGTLVDMTFEAGDYFQAMGISVLQGRPLETDDHLGALSNVVVSSSAAKICSGRGRTRSVDACSEGEERWETVVGVVEDVKQYGYRDPARRSTLYYRLASARRRTAGGSRHRSTW